MNATTMLSTDPTKHQCNLASSLQLSNSRQSCITQTWTTTTISQEFNKELTDYISSKAKWPHTTYYHHCHHASLLQPFTAAYTPMHYLTGWFLLITQYPQPYNSLGFWIHTYIHLTSFSCSILMWEVFTLVAYYHTVHHQTYECFTDFKLDFRA